MQTITLQVDDSIYQKFLTLVDLFPKSKLKITNNVTKEPNKETLKAIKDIEMGKNCETFSNAREMMKSYGI